MIPNSIKDDNAVITTTTDNVTDEAATETISITKEEETPEQRNQRILTHQLLAGQLEYYFSVTNLSRDTYLSTLRELNDGYVPLSIIANFGKVQAFAPYESAWDAVCAAATDYSDLLEMVELDEQGKKVSVITSESSSNNSNDRNTDNKTFLAVGTISGKAIPMSQIQSQQTQRRRSSNDDTTSIPNQPPSTTATISHPSTSPTIVRTPSSESAATASSINNNNVQNTIILREVSNDVEEKVVRSLFDFDNFPSIQKIHLDLHNCWFVTLDTSSRDEMVSVMMNLRTKKFPSGDSVKARLKSSASAATHSPLSATAVIYTHPKASTMYAPQFYNNDSGATDDSSNNGGSFSRKKRSSNYKGRNSNRDSNNGGSSNNNNYDNKANNQQGVVNGGHQMKQRNSKDKSSSLSQCSSFSSSNNISNIKAVTTVEKMLQSPPSMGEVHFPSLPPSTDDNSLPFQVEKVPTEDEMMRGGEKGRHSLGCLDSSSTATTTSTSSAPTDDTPSSSSNSGVVPGGYAAALLRPAAPTLVNTTTTSTKKVTQPKRESSQLVSKEQQRSSITTTSNKSKGAENSMKNNDKNKVETSSLSSSDSASASDDHPVVSIQPPAWGRGRSFADVLAAQ